MLSRVLSGTTIGLDGVLIDVEVDVAETGFPTFTIVGLPSKAIDEAKDRVRTAIVNAGFEMPDSRLTVNLAPADIPKEGSSFDLPIALGILASLGAINHASLANSIAIGELSLEGKVRHVPGIIAIALMARAHKVRSLFVPSSNVREASMVEGVDVFPVRSLQDLVLHLRGITPIAPYQKEGKEIERVENGAFDFKDIKGQYQAKRALEIAAAGFHTVHLTGPPGGGKTLLSRAFPSILPVMDKEESLEVTKIYSVAGLLTSPIITSRPFRSPHHTTSRIGLIGGGTHPSPGEVTLAHRGVLFLDEFAEFPRFVLESLRQPMEDGVITISRAAGSMTFPCRFLLIAASNPCPCGYLGHPKKRCRCMPGSILKYRKRLSGPLLDRIDMHLHVPPVDAQSLSSVQNGEESTVIRMRVEACREIQRKRYEALYIRTNGELSPREVRKYCVLSQKASDILKQAIDRLSLSARSYYKVMRIGRTIADLCASHTIDAPHVMEALQYRNFDE